MLKYNTLYKGKYISVVSPEGIATSYEVLHENKNGVLILPYLINEECFVIRKEYCPPYFIKDENPNLYYTLVSGGIEDRESDIDTVLRELEEETGIINPDIEWYENGECIPVCKSTDYRSTLYVLGIVDYDYIEPYGDGTVSEAKSISIKVTIEEIKNIIEMAKNYDMLLYMAYYKILDLLNSGRLE